ncbi:TetR/AcrR family transcriptional regulator [Nonomuraea rhodomycinica]|uniref:TetR/AcrR family transcriptional regulator n=1 Tax=Nonomuraea rhodomycinica TaxID=1712872 RepID=UPI0028ABEFAB|nr:helix-turn-helix domain-containing protein [Nonomuraea rhodomycinica]
MCGREPLPVLGQPQPERADAARNRRRILDVASRLIAERGAHQLSLDEVAREAGVGVGTVYRRFGHRTGLVWALIDEHERRFQAAFMTGPPPVGPGAPPDARLRAFLRARVDRMVAQQDIYLQLELGASKAGYSGPYWIHHTHVAALLAEARPDLDAGFFANALLAPVNARLIHSQLVERGRSLDEFKAGLDALITAVLHAPRGGRPGEA